MERTWSSWATIFAWGIRILELDLRETTVGFLISLPDEGIT